MNPKITIEPKEVLVDDKVKIVVSGLQKHQEISVFAYLSGCGKDRFESYAYYRADSDGNVDLTVQESFGGSYTGVEPMGLFWGMKPSSKNKRPHSRLVPRDVEKPIEVFIQIFDSNILYEDFHAPSLVPLAESSVKRWYKSHGVKRIPVKYRRIRGTLFVPEGHGPFPAVIDLFGTAGGLMEFRSSLLASRGILSLALAFFGYDDLPKTAFEIDLEYFEEAKRYLEMRSDIYRNGIGIVGVSVGGTLALDCATYIPGITCAVSLNGTPFNTYMTLSYNDRVWHPIQGNMNRLIIKDRGIVSKDVWNDHHMNDLDSAEIEFYKTEKSFLFICGEDDESVDPFNAMAVIKNRVVGSKCKWRIISYPGAGHLLEPPHSPHAGITHTKLFNLPQRWGGNPKQHSEAQEKSWKEIITYLKSNLTVEKSKL